MRTLRLSLVAVTFLLTSCSLPWNTSPPERETNVAFSLKKNQISLSSATIGGHRGDFLLATATRRTAVDPDFARRAGLTKHIVLRLGQRHKIDLESVILPLDGVADAAIGADAFPRQSLTIDYAKLLVILRPVPDMEQMARYPYGGAPSVPVLLNGMPQRAVIDTLVPDTMIIPARLVGRGSGRMNVSLSVGGLAFSDVDARVADIPDIHLGNRILANFLVTVDYAHDTVALWRDPRSSTATNAASVR